MIAKFFPYHPKFPIFRELSFIGPFTNRKTKKDKVISRSLTVIEKVIHSHGYFSAKRRVILVPFLPFLALNFI